MNARMFFNLVVRMRAAQKSYFRLHSSASLNESKALERQVDAEIERVTKIINKEEPVEGDLFNEQQPM